MHNGVRVAVKVIRMCFTSDMDDLLSVSTLLAPSLLHV